MKKVKGITLISLVITIIILIILAGVTINSTIGENGIFQRAKQSKVRMEIETYKEKIEIAKGTATVETEGKLILDNWIEQIYKDNIVEDGRIQRLDKDNAEITTVERYIFHIDSEGNINYIEQKEKDNTSPEASIELNETNITTIETISVTVTHKDEDSGINIKKCKYVWNTVQEDIGLDEDSYIEGKNFETNPQTLNFTSKKVGEYYLHILTVDLDGNKTETVSPKVIVTQIENVKSYDYTGKIEEYEAEYDAIYTIEAWGCARRRL